jgi:hypothetical protein
VLLVFGMVLLVMHRIAPLLGGFAMDEPPPGAQFAP